MDNSSIPADASLPDDPVLLKAMIRELLAAHGESQKEIDTLRRRFDLLLKRVYGPKSDRIHPDQPSLFDEADLPQPAPVPKPPRTQEPTVNADPVFLQNALDSKLDAEWTEKYHERILEVALAHSKPRFDDLTWEAFEEVWIKNRPVLEAAAKFHKPVAWIYVAKSRALKLVMENVQLLIEGYPFIGVNADPAREKTNYEHR